VKIRKNATNRLEFLRVVWALDVDVRAERTG
jgi:hypothetical protein